MTTIDSWRDQLLHAVAGAGLLGRPRRVRLPNGERGLEGTLTIAGRTVTIALIIDPLFENKIPTVLLRPWDALGFIPHIDTRGKICYVDPEGMLLDQNRQLQIIRECFTEVRRTLQAGVTGQTGPTSSMSSKRTGPISNLRCSRSQASIRLMKSARS